MMISKDFQNFLPRRECFCVLHSLTLMFEAIWLVRFQYHNQTNYALIHSPCSNHHPSVTTLKIIFKRRMRRKTTRLSIRKPLWVYEHAKSLDKLHGKNLARVKRLHTLLGLNVLKMLKVTSFEKINTVKKWTRMQNKQCNGVCPFNSSDPFLV